jgi:hypothetical protein
MPIEAHRNLSAEELGGINPGIRAAGSSNSNSHNAGGGGESSVEETRQIMSQLANLLPRLETIAAKAGPDKK